MTPPHLNVERSLTGKRWILKSDDPRLTQCLVQQLELPEIVARLLSARGIEPETAEEFLNPTLKTAMPDPSHLLDMDLGITRVAEALATEERIAIFGDYDVDGATSSALLCRYFSALGHPPLTHIPDRILEGYGPNITAFGKLRHEGATLIITVDCGTNAFEPLSWAKDNGLDVIVLDHHAAEPKLPEAYAIINPNRLDETSPCKNLAAVGLAFLFVVGLNRELRQRDWFTPERPEPNLLDFLDLVALGTVCDVVSLTGLNRAYVTQGLKIMRRRQNVGLTTLGDVAGINDQLSTYHAGFVLGPRINAGGRVGQANLGLRLLSSHDPVESMRLSKQLDSLNRERQEIENFVLEEALEQVHGHSASLALAAKDNWHPGVIGIVAGRLKEQYSKPAIVVALHDGIGKGSGRSVPGIDLGNLIHKAKQSGLLEAGGGHAMAAGFTVRQEQLPPFQAFMEREITARMAEIAYAPSLILDGSLHPKATSLELLSHLERIGPFGAGNPAPKFVFPHVRVAYAKVVGNGHVQCIFQGEDGAKLEAIAFRCATQDLGITLLSSRTSLHVAGSLKMDEWMGRVKIKLFVEDAAIPV